MSPPPSAFMLPLYELFEYLWEDGRPYNYQHAQIYFHLLIVGGFILGGLVAITALVVLIACVTRCGRATRLLRVLHIVLIILLTTTTAGLVASGIGASDIDPAVQMLITLMLLGIIFGGAAFLDAKTAYQWFGPDSRARRAQYNASIERKKAIPLQRFDVDSKTTKRRTPTQTSEESDENFIMLISDNRIDEDEAPYVGPPLIKSVTAAIIISIFVAFMYAMLFNGICVSFMPMHWSSSLTRLSNPTICDPRSVCHVYFTTTVRPDTSMRIHFHATYVLERPIIRFTSTGPGIANATTGGASTVTPSSVKLDNPYVDRWIYTAVVENLQPDTTYYFFVGENDDNGRERKVRTFPALGTPNAYTFVAGGDIGTTESATILLASAAKKEPLFFLAGGDLAYANSICACYYVWDRFLRNLDTIFVTPSGFSIPIFAIVGNHDVGGYERSHEDVKFYYTYFPSESEQSYRSMRFANTSLVGIDSDFQVRLAGHQESWTVNELSLGANMVSFAAYHLPLYPTTNAYYTASRVAAMRNSYVPHFETAKVDIAFEFHRHGYKRTKSLNGTIYIGDGCMGATESWDQHEDLPYLAKASSTSHYLHITVSQNSIRSDAVNLYGDTFDSVVI